jgi:hypothetical protein
MRAQLVREAGEDTQQTVQFRVVGGVSVSHLDKGETEAGKSIEESIVAAGETVIPSPGK